MDAPEQFVVGSEKLTTIFGYWPSFHDAEVIEIRLWRGDVDPDRDRYEFPVLTAVLHVLELTNETDARGSLMIRHHTLATLRFRGIEDVELAGFNYMNQIRSITLSRKERAEGPSPYISVVMQEAVGISASFKCESVEVVDAVPCDEKGRTAHR